MRTFRRGILHKKFDVLSLVCVSLLISSLSGCAGEKAYHDGMKLINQDQVTPGLDKLQQATREAPGNLQYRLALDTQRTAAANNLLALADTDLADGKLNEAALQYQQVLTLDGKNDRAKSGLHHVVRAQVHNQSIKDALTNFEAAEYSHAEDKVKRVLLENPKHREALSLEKKISSLQAEDSLIGPSIKNHKQLVTLMFRDAPVKMVFDSLSSSTAINFILDKDLNASQVVSVFVKQEPLDNALEMLLKSNSLAKKVVDANTVVVYSNTQQKHKEYDELVIKTFYLSNIEPKNTAELIRNILKAKDVFVDERLNMLVIRDTPERLRMAAKLIALQDMPEPEVVLEVTVVEVTRGKLLDIGAQFPTQFGVLNTIRDAAGNVINSPFPPTISVLKNLNSTNITANAPSINLSSQVSDINILANPRIRVRNREKAKIQIGERVPVITTTYTALTNTQTESVQYVDAGIKLEVEPNIFMEGDVSIKVSLEVSALGAPTTTKNGSTVYRLSTRNASTLLRLKDGETQLLAGLVNEEERKAINGLPFLSELPLIGRLFSNHQDNRQKSEVVLSITPRIVRNVSLPDAKFTQFWAGTEEQNFAANNADEGSIIMPPPELTIPAMPQREAQEASNTATGEESNLLTPDLSAP